MRLNSTCQFCGRQWWGPNSNQSVRAHLNYCSVYREVKAANPEKYAARARQFRAHRNGGGAKHQKLPGCYFACRNCRHTTWPPCPSYCPQCGAGAWDQYASGR